MAQKLTRDSFEHWQNSLNLFSIHHKDEFAYRRILLGHIYAEYLNLQNGVDESDTSLSIGALVANQGSLLNVIGSAMSKMSSQTDPTYVELEGLSQKVKSLSFAGPPPFRPPEPPKQTNAFFPNVFNLHTSN